jgi:DNA-directed RNA polymerase subunit omega
MNTQLVEEALEVVLDRNVLVNMISKRVRKLSNGSRPMVAAPFGAGLADIALQEVIEKKLTFKQPELADVMEG